MSGLIISDYKRFFKDKLFIVVCILAFVFAVMTPLLYAILFAGMGELDPVTAQMLAGYVSAKGQFFGAFSFGNNLGLIAPLLIGIILFKDFSFGTVRNKVICGHSRTKIFMSIFIVCATTLFGVVLAHAILTLGVSLPFFEYQSTDFVAADMWYLLESLLFELLVYIFAAGFVSWLCVNMKNVGMVIVMYIAVVFGLTMVAGVLQVVIGVMQLDGGNEQTIKILEFFQRINVFNSSATIGLGTEYSKEDLLYYILPPVVGTVAVLSHGVLSFNRKDIK